MTANQATLDQAARLCDRAHKDALRAGFALHRGNVADACERITASADATWETLQRLIEVGAARPEGVPAPKSDAATRCGRLLRPTRWRQGAGWRRCVRAAVNAAEEVDAEHGNLLPENFPLQPGETRGTGYAETISNLAERLRVEVEGPTRARGRQ
jgi:hypothetical protein